MAFIYLRIDEKHKKKYASHAKKMGYETITRFVKIALKELMEKDKRLEWKLYAEKTRGNPRGR